MRYGFSQRGPVTHALPQRARTGFGSIPPPPQIPGETSPFHPPSPPAFSTPCGHANSVPPRQPSPQIAPVATGLGFASSSTSFGSPLGGAVLCGASVGFLASRMPVLMVDPSPPPSPFVSDPSATVPRPHPIGGRSTGSIPVISVDVRSGALATRCPLTLLSAPPTWVPRAVRHGRSPTVWHASRGVWPLWIYKAVWPPYHLVLMASSVWLVIISCGQLACMAACPRVPR
mmetsp:Transcript_73841/g.130208  ORF Transcript_73841/g.130208 Transcript_73841/m.130208 type:complete len:230 (+) Transcript_73841:1347-2036(+)